MSSYSKVIPKKRLGQNFLKDKNIIDKIVRVSGAIKGDSVLEIGPGTGAMTKVLLDTGCRVTAVELDHDLIPLLSASFGSNPSFRLVHGDILRSDLTDLLGCSEDYNWRVVANLPYYITTPIIFKLLEDGKNLFNSICIMVQKEVADRIVSPPGGKEYGALSVAVQYHTKPSIKLHVPRTVFDPRPDVDSAIVVMDVYRNSPYEVLSESVFFAVVKAAFSQRRKTIRNTLLSGLAGMFSSDQILSALGRAGIDSSRRGETLSVSEYADLSNAFLSK